MTVLKDMLQAISLIQGVLTFWGFFLAIITIMLWIIVNGNNFNKVWSKVTEKKLKSTHFYKIIRLSLLFLFIMSITTIILVFSAPLLLELIQNNKEVATQIEKVQDTTDKVLKEIKNSQNESIDFKEKYKKAKLYRENKDYTKAIELLKKIEPFAKDHDFQQSVAGLLTNSYYKSGRHIEGLEYILQNYNLLSADDFRYRFDIHAHIRQIALKKGFKKAESVITELYSKYMRKDLSYVWIAIPLAKMEYLKNGVSLLDEYFSLSEEEENYLRNIIKNYPNDFFLDHAYYFLKEFDHLVKHYPYSLIMDTAMFSLARQTKGVESREISLEYLKRWPNSSKRMTFESLVYLSYIYEGDLDNSLKILNKYEHLDFYDVSRKFYSFKELDISTLLKTADKYGFIKEMGECIERNFNYFDKAIINFKKMDFNSALDFYQKIEKVFSEYSVSPFKAIEIRKKQLTKLAELQKHDTAEGLLNLGLFIRDVDAFPGKYSLSMEVFKACAKRYPDSVEAEKCLYLLASVFRQIGYYKKSLEILKEFAIKYPNSHLIDDCIAEIGVYYLLNENKFKIAKKYFDIILTDFPHSNAADNTLNWIAWHYLEKKDYPKALKYYSLLTKDYIETRLGRRAVNTTYKLDNVIKQSQNKNDIIGLKIRKLSNHDRSYVSRVEKNSNASKIGLKYKDVILKINNNDILKPESFYKILENFKPGDSINIEILRFKYIDKEEDYQKEFLTLRANVDNQEFYPIPYDRTFFRVCDECNEDMVLQLRIEDFVLAYLNVQSHNNISKTLDLYDEKVEYYNKKLISKDELKKDKEKYFAKWPIRYNTIASDINIKLLPNLTHQISFNYQFIIKNGGKKISGTAKCDLKLKKEEGYFVDFVIVSEKGEVIKKL